MKYALAFLASFALLAGLTAFVRVQASDAPVAKVDPQEKQDEPTKEAAKKDPHAGHNMGDKKEDAKDDTKKDDAKDDARKEDPEWGGDVKTDLANKEDPVSGDTIEANVDQSVVYHGFKVHFAEEKSIKKFKRRPIEFFVALKLELTKDGEVKQVDPADFKDTPVIPETCPLMGGDITTDDGVYIFHRGYKIYFCCWNGCWKDFLAEPAKYYGDYGLVEKDGKLTPKSK